MVICTLFILFYAPFLRILEDGLKRTFFHTNAALNALILINGEWCVFVSGDTLSRAVFLTDAAPLTAILVNDEFNHGFTYARRTFFLYYVSDIFITEIFHSGKNRIRGSLAQSAEGGSFDILCQNFQLVLPEKGPDLPPVAPQ